MALTSLWNMGKMNTAMNLITKYKEVITDTIIVRPLLHLWGDPVLDQHLSLEETPYSTTTSNTLCARGQKGLRILDCG